MSIKPMTALILSGVMGCCILLSSCSGNVYTELTQQDTDEALLAEAKKLINNEEYSLALAKLQEISADALAKKKYQLTFAAAEAGECGLNFINFFSRISQADSIGGSGIFSFLMAGMAGTPVQAAYCASAMARMRALSGSDSIGDTTDEQLFISILGMALIGSVLSEKADIDGVDGNGDGSVDATFDICSSANSTDISNDMLAEFLSSFGMIILNIGGLAGGDAVVTAVGDFAASCDQLKTDPTAANPCSVTDPSTVGTTEVQFIRMLLDAEGFNPGSSCDDSSSINFAATCCP